MFLTNYLIHRIDRDIITYSVGVSRIDAEVEDFIKKNIRKNLKKSKNIHLKKMLKIICSKILEQKF